MRARRGGRRIRGRGLGGGRGGRAREGDGGRDGGVLVDGARVVVLVVVGKVEDGRGLSLWEDAQSVECAGAAFVREGATAERHL